MKKYEGNRKLNQNISSYNVRYESDFLGRSYLIKYQRSMLVLCEWLDRGQIDRWVD